MMRKAGEAVIKHPQKVNPSNPSKNMEKNKQMRERVPLVVTNLLLKWQSSKQKTVKTHIKVKTWQEERKRKRNKQI